MKPRARAVMTEAVHLALEAFRQRPNDDARRQVLADALLEAGDPRGEYIALVRTIDAGQHSGTAWHRAQELFRQHSAHWVSDLGTVFRNVEFKGGFPDRAELLDLYNPDATRSAMRSLSALTLTHVVVFDGAAGVAPVLQSLPSLTSLSLSTQSSVLAEALSEQLTSLSTTRLSAHPFPNLRTLTLNSEYGPRGSPPMHLATLVNAMALKGLEQLTIVDQRQQLERQLSRWDAAGCRRLVYPPHLELERLEDHTTRAVLVGAPERYLRRFARLAPASLRFVKIVGSRDDESLARLGRSLPLASIEFLRP